MQEWQPMVGWKLQIDMLDDKWVCKLSSIVVLNTWRRVFNKNKLLLLNCQTATPFRMCSSNPREVLPFGVKVPNPTPHVQFGGNMSQVAVDLHRAQGLYDYRARLQYGIRAFPLQLGFGLYPGPSSTDPFLHHYVNKEPRIRYVHEEPKSNLSYIGLIGHGHFERPRQEACLERHLSVDFWQLSMPYKKPRIEE